MNSLQGQLLVATSHQLDPYFSQTVVLIVEHDHRGAFGVIISRPTPLVVSGWGGEISQRRRYLGPRLELGGPVTGPMMALHADPLLAELEILPGLFFSAREENVADLWRQSRRRYRTFLGYSGWGPGQLEEEIERGIWMTRTATMEHVFGHSETLWADLFRELSQAMLRFVFHIRHIPQDPLMN